MLKKFLLPVLLSVALPALAAGERLLFWELPGERAHIYLLGSMHLARADIYPLRREIMQGFAESDTLAVEVDIGGGNSLAIQEMMLARGMYPAGESLRDHLSAGTWRALQAYLQTAGLPEAMLERMKPGLAVTTLSTVEMMKLGLSPALGIDNYFLEQARGKKEIEELETIEQQLDVLFNVPDADLFVRQTLSQLQSMDTLMEQLIDSWKSGDSAALQKLVLDDELEKYPEFKPVYERMFDQRNRGMTERILQMQNRGGRYFVVVGAGHLVGDEGIISLLEKRGLKPRQL